MHLAHTQGCPSTLGANRKSQYFFERAAARDPRVRSLFTATVIQRIEMDIGCKIKMEEKFIIVSGKDRLILAKGVDAVHKVIKGESDQKGSYSSQRSRSRSPKCRLRLQRSESQRSYSGHPHEAPQYQKRFSRQDKNLEERFREDPQKLSINSPQAFGKDGARSCTSHSRSLAHTPSSSNSYSSYDGRNHSTVSYRTDGWGTERRGTDMQSGHHLEYSAYSQTLEEMELEYKEEAMELARIRDKEEDEENYKHRETVREIRENYMKKLAVIRSSHSRFWGDFIRLEAQRCEQQPRQQIPLSGFGGYKPRQYSDYDDSSANTQLCWNKHVYGFKGQVPPYSRKLFFESS